MHLRHNILERLTVSTCAAVAVLLAAAYPAPCRTEQPGAEAVLKLLKEGNERFVAGTPTHPDQSLARIIETASGQSPLATILACSDSRVPPELVFDLGVGDLFVIRVASNVSDTDEIGTAEYGVKHLGTPLLVVLGHTNCGAVKAVCTGAEAGGSIPALVDNIVPAVERAQAATGLAGEALVSAAVVENVWQSIADLIRGSETVAGLLRDGKLMVVGALYELENGKVDWLGEHPEQGALLVVGN